MKEVKAVLFALVFVVVAGFAQPPSQVSLPSEALAAILSQPAVNSSCPTQAAAKIPIALQGAKVACSATCPSGTQLSCPSGTTSCSAKDSNCSILESGYVTCNGVTTSCAPCCPTGSFCCQCGYTGRCFDCCRCAGGTPHQCVDECG